MRLDSNIQQDVQNELQWSPFIDASDIAVRVKNGTVELAGFVKRYSDKFDAEDAAKKVAGVVALANDIEIRLPDVDQRPDPDIARDAVSAIGYSLLGIASNVRPVVKNGWITLEGSVNWNYEKEEAGDAVRSVRGVKGVSNLIEIKPTVVPSDIKRKIESALMRNAAIDADRIRVEAVAGKVTLKGTVRSWAERDQAETAAWAAPGVTSVDDQMTIRF